MTGNWVSVVTEDWLWRMTTRPKGDASSIPLNPNGRKVANEWDPSTDGSCKAFGAAALMRMPTRVRVSWESDEVLKVETDAGQQTRRLVFGKPRPAGVAKSAQGYSAATWVFAPPAPFRAPPIPGAPPAKGGDSLMVTTTDMTAGWLRRNGIPYSENARMTEYFDVFALDSGEQWFVVTTLVDDPEYLAQQYYTSSHFRREKDGAKWDPQPCKPVG